MRRILPLLLPLLLLAPSRAQEGDPNAELTRLIQQMESRESQLRELSQQEHSITRALGELDESIASMEQEAARLDESAQAAQKRIQETEQRAAKMGRELEATEALLAKRLRAVMRLGPSADIQLMLGSHSLKDLIWRRAVLRRMAAGDAALARDVEQRRVQLLAERRELVNRRAEHGRARADLDRARKAASSVRLSRAQALADVATQKQAMQLQLEDLVAAKRKLTELIEDLPPSPGATGFAALRGRLPWPTEGFVEIPFGPHLDETTGLETTHSGITVAAPLGQKVQAVANGKVVHAGWLRGYGQLLILDHGEGFHSLAAHLSRVVVQAGDEVAEGDVVAYVGDSESIKGPCLYFELRSKGRPVNPLKWLRRER